MPDGKTHAAMTMMAAGAISVVMWKTGFTPEEIRLATTGCLTGLVLTPDLDVDHGPFGNQLVKKYLGEIAGRVWKSFWLPYAWVFPHRSNGSHIPVIGTLGRALYLYAMYFCICVDLGATPWVPGLHTALYLLSGLVVSDTLHYIADIISTALKRRRNASLPILVRRMRARRRAYARLQSATSQKTQRLRR
jgi:uncharacterized metal-binding protein